MPPAGNHVARMVAALNLGCHEEVFKNSKTQSERKSCVEKVLFGWQLTACSPAGVVFKDFNLAFSPQASLRLLMQKLRGGREYQLGELIDPLGMLKVPCLVTIVHKTSAGGKVYYKIDGIGPVPSGLACPAATIEPLVWEFGSGPWPSAPWLPAFWYGEPIADFLSRAKLARPSVGGPATAASANGVDASAASAPPQTPAPPAAPESGQSDCPF
jgi:hypothetical protein